MQAVKKLAREKRKKRIRGKINGTAQRPRLAVFRSSTNINAQVIDDTIGKTLLSASTLEKEVKAANKSTGNIDAAKAIGKTIAERATKAGIKEVVFDRGGYLFHGRVKALADAAREAGLKF